MFLCLCVCFYLTDRERWIEREKDENMLTVLGFRLKVLYRSAVVENKKFSYCLLGQKKALQPLGV